MIQIIGKITIKEGNETNMAIKVPRRIATTLMNSLKGGVVPRIGLRIYSSRQRARNKSFIK